VDRFFACGQSHRDPVAWLLKSAYTGRGLNLKSLPRQQMKASVQSIAKFAVLYLAASVCLLALAQEPPPSSANDNAASVAGTTWAGPDTMGRHYEYEFLPDGTLHYTYENGSFTDGTWKQDGDAIYMSMNNKYSERQGRISGTHMAGKAWNVVGKTWTWEADRQIPPPPSANGTAASLAGSSWDVIETEGDRDIFNFQADGTLNYSYQNGTYSNGIWKQDGDAIYIEMNNKFVEYTGRITGSHIEGKAWNVKGRKWTWVAEKR
jgi:outer membrane biogenesis lipoprotein LolB